MGKVHKKLSSILFRLVACQFIYGGDTFKSSNTESFHVKLIKTFIDKYDKYFFDSNQTYLQVKAFFSENKGLFDIQFSCLEGLSPCKIPQATHLKCSLKSVSGELSIESSVCACKMCN